MFLNWLRLAKGVGGTDRSRVCFGFGVLDIEKSVVRNDRVRSVWVHSLSLTGEFDWLAEAGRVQDVLPMDSLACLCRLGRHLLLRRQTALFIVLGG